jgi:23S rRNA pseudouridine1911/1915/1917 synthase
MVAAKDDAALGALARQFKAHSINRRYLALVHGLLPADRGTVDRPIGRHTTERKKMSGKTRSGRRAVTHWRVLRRFDQERLTLVELTLETGRTHQIRVHFSEMSHPVVGDPVYGSSGRTQALTDPVLRQRLLSLHRQALHARVLGFIHPATGTYMEFESPVPEDLRQILEYLERKYQPAPDR